MPQPPTYPPQAVQPMRDELSAVGFEQIGTPEEIDKAVRETKGTLMCVINSVCGCAAGGARPAVAAALQNKLIPDRLVTVFAGNDREAVARVRELHAPVPPSSPSIVFWKDGKLAGVMERGHIEGRGPNEIAGDLVRAFDKLCTKQGPSIPRESYEKLEFVKQCGSNIPRFKG
jgi:putative YphP/YqiW family bacilliredoxin